MAKEKSAKQVKIGFTKMVKAYSKLEKFVETLTTQTAVARAAMDDFSKMMSNMQEAGQVKKPKVKEEKEEKAAKKKKKSKK